jgi:hypothetical protein
MGMLDFLQAKQKHWIHDWVGKGQRVAPHSSYVTVALERMQIPYERKWFSSFHGVINSQISLIHEGTDKAVYQKVSPDAYLLNLKASQAQRVIVGRQALAGPVPYRGGPVELRIALISIKKEDLSAPYLKLLGEISEAAGVTFISAALPYVGFLKRGIELLTGTADKESLQIGLDECLEAFEVGTYAIVAAERSKYPRGSLKCNEDFSLTVDGIEIPEAYLVLSFSAEGARWDWHSIPELKQHHTNLTQAVKAGERDQAKAHQVSFNRAALLSPDLLPEDAKRIIGQVEGTVTEAAAAGQKELTPLNKLDPFGHPLGLFPKFIPDIRSVVSKATRGSNILIACDYAIYGLSFSVDGFLKYFAALKEANARECAIQVILCVGADGLRLQQNQNKKKGEAAFDALRTGDPTFRQSLEELRTIVQEVLQEEAPSRWTREEWLRLIILLEKHYEQRLNEIAELSVSPKVFTRYLWVTDTSAIKVFSPLAPEKRLQTGADDYEIGRAKPGEIPWERGTLHEHPNDLRELGSVWNEYRKNSRRWKP